MARQVTACFWFAAYTSNKYAEQKIFKKEIAKRQVKQRS